ncbi:hypothetical protein PsorP6_007348 [Peronosclerospora sorghi]|uniref:Uncharacterized protein n=1 Tax=Peronosclerospora sorghi TaxID=230839 RepID=A0ACC0WB26_9STRA|nr:hypothetical protein PsorP6_007348 [Peronosclerospora sorghi]
MQLPAANRHSCVSYEAPHDAIVLVDRGKCSVVAQALQAQASRAHGLIVRWTKEDVYEAIPRDHAPASKPVFEYDCIWRGGLIPVLYAVACAATMAQVVDTWLSSLAERELSIPLVDDTVRCRGRPRLAPFECARIHVVRAPTDVLVCQDLMGICLCVAFLRKVVFPNLSVAKLLLSLACCNDVFFVFV